MMRGNAPQSEITHVPGWLTHSEENLLREYARKIANVPASVIVNIGCEFGRSVAALAAAANKATVYGVELAPKSEFITNMQEAGVTAELVSGDSGEIGKTWERAIDLLFIDGDHSYAGATRDIQSWVGHVKTDGFVLFHDSVPLTNRMPHYLHHEVQRAIEDWLTVDGQRWREQPPVDSIRVFQRIGSSASQAIPKKARKATR